MGRNYALNNHQVAEAVVLYGDGLSMDRISDIFVVSPTAVKSALVLSGIQIRGKREQARMSSLTVERLRLNCVITKAGCWIWQGTPNKNGFCVTWHQGEREYIHRIAYKLHTGKPLRPGQVVVQDCENKLCCGPECLEVTNRRAPIYLERVSRGQQRASALAHVSEGERHG